MEDCDHIRSDQVNLFKGLSLSLSFVYCMYVFWFQVIPLLSWSSGGVFVLCWVATKCH